MVTPRQLIRGARTPPKSISKRFSSPQIGATIIETGTANPKKPNSARRAIVKVRLSNGRKVTASVPGEKHNLKEFYKVLVRGGGAQDLPGVSFEVVPGALDSPGIIEGRQHARSTSRSKYGTPKPKK